MRRKAEQELLYEREKLEAAFDQQLKKEVGGTRVNLSVNSGGTCICYVSDSTFEKLMGD